MYFLCFPTQQMYKLWYSANANETAVGVVRKGERESVDSYALVYLTLILHV